MEDFKQSITFIKSKDIKIRVNIAYKSERLSITGDIYEFNGINWRDIGGGQCYEELLENFPECGRLVEIWIRWHLNDMCAGDSIQEAYLRALKDMGTKYNSYEARCNALEQVGLLEHDGYKYGTKWLVEPVPAEILKELKEIKGTK